MRLFLRSILLVFFPFLRSFPPMFFRFLSLTLIVHLYSWYILHPIVSIVSAALHTCILRGLCGWPQLMKNTIVVL